MVMYYTDGYLWDPSIKAVEVERVTESSVWADSRRRARTGAYFDTWEEAHAHLLMLADRKLHAAQRALETAQAQYGSVKGMKEPHA